MALDQMANTVRNITALALLSLAGGPITAFAASQTIAFDAIPNQIFGVSPFVIAAQASSGLPVSFASTTPAVCKTAGSLVMLLSAGPCFITASQAGNGSFSAAPQVTQSFTVSQAKPAGRMTAAAGSPFAAGALPFSIVSADFNGDGYPDFAALNGGGGLTVLLGNSSGGFTTANGSPFPTPANPAQYKTGMATGDFNADGIPDLVFSLSSSVVVYLGNGSGGFTNAPGSPFSLNSGPGIPVVGDFNGDGIQDLAIPYNGEGLDPGFNTTVAILLGNGAGGFSAATGSPITFGVGSAGQFPAISVAVGDFNGDGIQDLVAADTENSTLTVLLGNGSGGFTAAAAGPVGFGRPSQYAPNSPLPAPVVVGDFNGDGIQDIATANFSAQNVAVFLGDGLGGFTAAPGSPLAVGSNPSVMAGADFNGDGIPDLVVGGRNSANVTVLLGNGSGAFTLAGTFAVGLYPATILAGDFNGDGVEDVAAAEAQSGNIVVLLGGQTASGAVLTTTSPATITVGQPVALTLAVSDTGTAYSAPSGTVTFMDGTTVLGTASQTASPYTFSATGLSAGSHTLTAVYGGDSRTSGSTSNAIVIEVQLTQTISFGTLSNVALGMGNVTLAATASSGLAVSYASSTQNVCTVSGSTVTLMTFGTCSITASQEGNTNYVAAMPVVQSFIVSPVTPTVTSVAPNTVAAFSPATTVTIAGSNFIGGAKVLFTPPGGVAQTISPSLIQAAQVMATVPASFLTTAGTAQVAVNNGFAAFSTPVTFTITPGAQTISFDAIPNQILGVSPFVIAAQASSLLPVSFASTTPAVCTTASNLVVLLSAGACSITASQGGSANYGAAISVTRSFTVSTAKVSSSFMAAAGSPIPAGANPRGIAAGDFNGDGIPDLAIANAGSASVTVLLGNTGGGFTQAPGSPFATGAGPFSVAVGDFNADGFQDLATANTSGNNVTVLLGNGAGGFSQATGSPYATTGPEPIFIAVGDFNGDGIQDLVTANAESNFLTVLTGNGSGGFTGSPFGMPRVRNRPVSVAVGDFNGDGVQDLAVANNIDSNVTILLGSSAGGFTESPQSPVAVRMTPTSVAIGDFNGDGIQDLIVKSDGAVGVLLGDGMGGFTASSGTPFILFGDPLSVAVADFNGDGLEDIAAASLLTNNVDVALGDGKGGFAWAAISPLAAGAEPIALAVADFNGDGIEDMAVANWTDGTVTVLLGFAAGNTPQSITFNTLPGVMLGVAPLTIIASTDSGLAVSLASSTPGVCSVAGTTVTVVAAGTCSIVASQAGNATYAPAATVSQSFVVTGHPQTVTFGPLSDVSLGTLAFTVNASASTGLPITFSSSTTPVCTVTPGGTVAIVALGMCSITATQAGNATYAMASVTQSFSVVTGATCSSMLPSPTVVPPEIRGEGTMEQVSDILVGCTGGNGEPMNIAVSISPSINITSLMLGSGTNAQSEALAGLNSTATTLAAGTVNGVASGNSIVFTGVPTGTGAFTVTVTNIRVNASQITAPLPTLVTAAVAVSGAGATPTTLSPPVPVAYAHYGLGGIAATGATSNAVCSAISAASPAFNVQFGEDFPYVFKTPGSAATNSTLGSWYANNTETGYGVSAGGVSNTAASGTRIRIVFHNIPANVAVYVPIAATDLAGSVALTASETGPFSAVPASTAVGAPAGTAALVVTNGSATAVYEVTADSISELENYNIPVYLAAAAGTAPSQVVAMTATVSFAPIGASGNLPNFVSASTTTTVSGSTFSACGSTISFGTLSDQVLGSAPITLSATGTSGVPVTFASTKPGVCTVAGNVATLTGAGKCSITASEAANPFYSAAAPVTESFNVTVVTPAVTSITPNTVPVFSGPTSVTIAGSNFVSGAQVSFTPPGGTTQTIAPSLVQAAQLMATIPAAFLTTAGTAQVAVTNGFTAFSNQVQFTITKATQTMSFDAIPNQIFGGSPFVIAAKASSGLPVGFASTTPGVCKAVANQVLLVKAGTCSITATQSGNAGYTAVSATRSFSVSQAKPSGTLTAASGSPFTLAADPTAMVVGDFNGDGIPDIATAGSNTPGNESVSVLLGNGSGGFTPAPGPPAVTGFGSYSMATGDFNQDGFLDLAVANEYSGNVTVLLGNGSGSFVNAPGSPFAVDGSPYSEPYSMAVGDFNGDGIADIVTANQSGQSLSILLGDGQGGFSKVATVPTAKLPHNGNPTGLAVGDFNGDGIQDLAEGNQSLNNAGLFIGNGSAGFTNAAGSPFAAGGAPVSVAAGDFNGDGIQDVTVADIGSSDVTVLLGSPSGFIPAPGGPFAAGIHPNSIAVADLNGDGIQDLAVSNNESGNMTILLGNGIGGFAPAATFPTGFAPTSVVAADFNGDGIMDLATIRAAGVAQVTILLGGVAHTESSLSTTAPATIAVGQGVPLTLTVSNTVQTFTAPEGPVTFLDGTTVLGTETNAASPYIFVTAGLTLGTHTFSAVYSGDSRSTGSASNTVTIQVLAAQSISFGALPNVALGTAAFALSATASSGDPVSFASGTPVVCSVTGNMVTILASGGCSIIASQAGDTTYAAAPPVTQKFTVFFGDVAPGDNDYAAINAMAQLGITAGCGSNGFCPNENVTRDEMAIFIVRAIYGNDNFTYTTTPYFTDVTSSTFGFKWIQKLKDLGITGGCTTTTYCPGAVVTRDQMAVFIIRARLGLSIAGPGPTFTYPSTPYFTDATATGEFAFPWIQRMKLDGITSGCTATTYCPSDPVTRGQMAIFIMRGAFNQFLTAGTPVISSISPATLTRGYTGAFTITGVNTNFVQDATVISPIPGVTIGAVTVNSPTSLTVQLTAASNAIAQPYSILAITGSEQDVLPNGLVLQ